jgi:hypothetical protein
MKNSEKSSKTELEVIPKAENKQIIENHKKSAAHFEAAAKSHLAAAKHYESGNHGRALKHTVEAYGHSNAANEAQKEVGKHHTSKS